jgi:hypothetical protein
MDHFGVATRVLDEHPSERSDGRGDALRLLEALRRITSRGRERERSDGYVVGQVPLLPR